MWRPAVEEVARRHGLDRGSLRRPTLGANVVFFAGEDRVIKLLAPLFASERDREVEALRLVRGRLGVATPESVATGELEGWPYLLMTRVDGVPVKDVWGGMGAAERDRFGSDLGAIFRRIHAIPADGAAALPRITTREPLVLCNADVTRDHALMARDDSGWRIASLIDFADALLAPKELEFVAPAQTIFPGERGPVRAMLLAYGYRESALDARLRRRLMCWTWAHPFGDVIHRARARGCRTVAEVETMYWPIG